MKEVRSMTRKKKFTQRLLSGLMAFVMGASMVLDVLPAMAAYNDMNKDTYPRAKLVMDFLGDNKSSYYNDGGPAYTGTGGSGAIVQPADHDMQWQTGDAADNTKWQHYVNLDQGTGTQTILWLGIGIEDVDSFVLTNGGKGLYSAELGLVYDPAYLEPYVDPNVNPAAPNFKDTIAHYNIGTNAKNQWPDSYEVTQALAGVAPRNDDIDTLAIGDPTIERYGAAANAPAGYGTQEFGAAAGWKMVYLSFQQVANATNTRFTDTASYAKGDTYYIAMVPFVLKSHPTAEGDNVNDLRVRLVRNAAVFSMASDKVGTTESNGVGDYGDGAPSFGNWDKYTYHDPQHDLKLMLDYTGDLNLFTGNRVRDEMKADLLVRNVSASTDNYARLIINNEPLPTPSQMVSGDGGPGYGTWVNHGSITGLSGGEELRISIHAATGYTAALTVTTTTGQTVTVLPVATPDSAFTEEYTFIVPTLTQKNGTVTVNVEFSGSGDQNTPFDATLIVDDGGYYGSDPKADRNDAQMSFSPAAADRTQILHNGSETIRPTAGTVVTVTVHRHRDYTFYPGTTPPATPPVLKITDSGNNNVTYSQVSSSVSSDGMVYTHTYTFTMPSSDVEVEVDFHQAQKYTASIQINTDSPGVGLAANTALLSANGDPPNTSVVTGVTPLPIVGNSFSLTDGRIVTVETTCAPGYEVKRIEFRHMDETPDNTLTATPLPGSPGNYTFSMPARDVKVIVHVGPVQAYKVKLVIVDGDQAYGEGARLAHNGSVPTPTDLWLTQAQVYALNAGDTSIVDILNVLAGAQVSVVPTYETTPGDVTTRQVGLRPGRTISVDVKYPSPTGPNGVDTIIPSGSASAGYSFNMIALNDHDNDKVVVTVTFKDETKPPLTARIVEERPANIDAGTTALWQVYHHKNDIAAYEGDSLVVDIHLEPGDYIAGVIIEDFSGTATTPGIPLGVPYTLTGIGYNNGAGGNETATFEMQNVNTAIRIIYGHGIPDPEPTFRATTRLTASGTLVLSGVSADVTTKNVTTNTTVGPNSAAINPAATVTAKAGDAITSSYTIGSNTPAVYVKSVTVTADVPGTTVPWTLNASGEVEIASMPAANVIVTIELAQVDPAKNVNLAVAKSEPVANTANIVSTTISGGTISTATPPATTTVQMGEFVKVRADVAPGWHIDHVTVSDASISHTLTGTGYNGGAGGTEWITFTMPDPAVNTTVTVYYAQGAPANTLTVKVTEPGGGNSADVSFDTTTGTATMAAPWGPNVVAPGTVVTVKAKPQAGYFLDLPILETPTGLLTLNWVAPNTFTFTMSAEPLTVTVPFDNDPAGPDKFYANLILRPDGTTITSLPTGTKGSFEAATGSYIRLDANNCLYSRSALPGEDIPYSVWVPDGYYISDVSVTPASLGVMPTITGMIGKQRGDFAMPAANVYLNITISKGWPDQVEYPVRLHVTAPAPNSSPAYSSATLENRTPGDTQGAVTVPGDGVASAVGMRKAKDGDKMQVVLLPGDNHTLKSVRLEDGSGAEVSYTWTTDGSGHLALEFSVPGSSVDVYVEYEEGKPKAHTVTLHTVGVTSETVTLANTNTGASITANGASFPATFGDQIGLTVTPNGSTALITSAYAVASDGTMVSLGTPALQGAFVDDTTVISAAHGFGMPFDVDVDVYLTFVSTSKPGPDEHILTLLVRGDTGSGAVLVTDTVANKNMSATATGSNAMVAKDNAKITAKVTPTNANYALYSLIAYQDDGTRVLVSLDSAVAAGDTYTFTMPAHTTHIEAEFRAVRPNAYQIQVVVNNTVNGGLGANNDANLYQPIGAVNALGKFKAGVSAGDTFDLGFSIDPGYQLDSIIAIPQGSGVVANIPLPTTVGGRTQVKMPASDLVIYVTFKMDTTTRFDVIGKILYGPASAAPVAGKGRNEVTLTGETSNPLTDSVYSGADAGGFNADDALIQEAADKKVKATWKCATGYAVASYEVVTAVGGNYVLSQPFDDNGDGVIDGLFFMMETEPIEVRVIFVDTTKDQPKDFTATLHYMTPDGDDGATLSAVNRTPNSAYTVNTDTGVIHSLHVGDKLDVTGTTNGSGWIRTVYVLQKTPAAASGQMIYTYTFPNGTQAFSTPDIHFFMPSGDVDVYVVFSATKPQPDEYTATLTVSGPTSANPPAGNYAVLEELDVAGNPTTVTTGQADCNQGPKSMVTTTGKTIRLTVTVDAAHEIDTINGTPISLLLVPDPVPGSNGLVYTFTMPASDVGIMVILKEKTAVRYDLHLYTKNIDPPAALDTDANETTVSYGTAPGESLTNIGTQPTGSDPVPTLKVPAGRPVTLTVKPIAGYYVDAAYAVTGYGLVQLTPDPATLPAGYTGSRLTDVGLEGATIYDIASDTNIAIFTMPAATTDVYVHYKKGTPPTTPWYNLVVIATDTGAPTANVGVNYAAAAVDGTPIQPTYNADGFTLTNPATDPYAVASTGMAATYYSLSAGDAVHMNAANSGVYTVGTTNYVYQYDANIGMVLTAQAPGVLAPTPVNEDSAGHPRGELQGFPMPASNLSVRVNFETVRTKDLWAGLHVTYNAPLNSTTDSWHTSTDTGNKVEMSVDDPNHRAVNNDYALFPEDDDHNRLKDLTANVTVATVTWPTTGVKVLQVVVTRVAADGTPLGSTVAVHPGGNSYTYVMGDESVEIYVALAKDDADHYVAYATPSYKDGLTAADGWLVPLKKGGGVTNETTAGLPRADFWTEVQPDDQVKTVFEAKANVYAEMKAYRDDSGAEIPLAQFGVGNGSQGYGITQVPNPGSDVHIVVTFSKTPPTPKQLTFENKDHKNQKDNTAKLTVDDNSLTDKTYTLQPDATALDPMVHVFADPVTPGTGLDLKDTKAATGYRVKQVDVKVTTNAGPITVTYYWKEISGTYQLVDASNNPVNLVMPTQITTVTVIYDQETKGVVPYDPDNGDTATYPIDHHIVAENRGDYLIVTVPMLNLKSDLTTADATSVDGKKHTFDLYLQTDPSATVDATAGTVTPAPTKVTNLLTFSNPKVFYENATLPASGTGHYEYQEEYELKNFYDAGHTGSTLGLNGARFIVKIKPDGEIEADVDADITVSAANKASEKTARKANAAILRAIMDNDGTMGDTDKYHMYITATTHETPGAVSPNDVTGGYVDIVVPKYYAIVGTLESYAPTHIATFTADAGITGGYKGQYPFVSTLVGETGVELWSQEFVVKLTSDWDKLQGKEITLTIEKAGHVTYTRTAIKMINSDTDPENIATDGTTKLYDDTAKTFTIEQPIRLIAGDLDGNGAVKARDVDIISDFFHGSYEWTTATSASSSGWAYSVYNPDSLAYAADLNGDGAVNARDLDVMMEPQNYNKNTRTYGSPSGLKNGGYKFYSLRRAAPMAASAAMAFPQWAYDRIVAGVDLPRWVWDALDEDLYLPDWAVQLVLADADLPQWAIDLALNFGEMPQWAMDRLLAGETLPDWTAQLAQAGMDLPQWAADLVLADQDLPRWAVDLLLAGEALPDWAQLLLENGEPLPEEPLTEEEIAALLTPELPVTEQPLPEGEVPIEGAEVPAEGEKMPEEGEKVPNEGEKEPAEGAEEPSEEVKQEPDEGETPVEGEKEPVEGEKEPVEGEDEPKQPEENPDSPTRGEEPETPPAEGESGKEEAVPGDTRPGGEGPEEKAGPTAPEGIGEDKVENSAEPDPPEGEGAGEQGPSENGETVPEPLESVIKAPEQGRENMGPAGNR